MLPVQPTHPEHRIGSSFPKSYRLRKRSEFVALKVTAHKYSGAGFLVVWLPNGDSHARLGITVSKRVGSSVTRNRIKRFVREVFRDSCSSLPAVDINIIARNSSPNMTFCSVRLDILNAFKFIGM